MDATDAQAWAALGKDAELAEYFSVPRLSHVFQVARQGSIAVVFIACPWTKAFADKALLVRAAADGAEWAAERGAAVVSMTGVIPAASSGGLDVQRELERRGVFTRFPDFKGVTHGHETVASAFLLNMDRILTETGRVMAQETVLFLGLGHIGEATLYLTLEAVRLRAWRVTCAAVCLMSAAAATPTEAADPD